MRASDALAMVLQPRLNEVVSAAKRFEHHSGMEEVHRLRVAIRRTHTAVTVFRDLAPAGSTSQMETELRRLQRRIGIVREWDVFIGGALLEGIEPMGKHRRRISRDKVRRRRKKAARRCAADFGGRRFRKLMRHLKAFAVVVGNGKLNSRAPAELVTRDSLADRPVSAFAQHVLHEYYERFRDKQGKARDLDSSHLHALRIRVKKLRYVAEFFRELYAVRPMKHFLSTLTRFQDQLGEVHDFYIAQSILTELCDAPKRQADVFKGHIDTLAKLTSVERDVRAAAAVIGIDHRVPPMPSGVVLHD